MFTTLQCIKDKCSFFYRTDAKKNNDIINVDHTDNIDIHELANPREKINPPFTPRKSDCHNSRIYPVQRLNDLQ